MFKLVPPFWKAVWQYGLLLNIFVLTLINIWQISEYKKTHAENVYSRALFVIVKNVKQCKCPSVVEWVSWGLSVWCIHSTGSLQLCYSVLSGSTVSATPENLLEMRVVRLHPRYTEPTCTFLHDPRWFLRLIRVGERCFHTAVVLEIGPGPAALASPGNWREMQIRRPHAQNCRLRSSGVGTDHLF